MDVNAVFNLHVSQEASDSDNAIKLCAVKNAIALEDLIEFVSMLASCRIASFACQSHFSRDMQSSLQTGHAKTYHRSQKWQEPRTHCSLTIHVVATIDFNHINYNWCSKCFYWGNLANARVKTGTPLSCTRGAMWSMRRSRNRQINTIFCWVAFCYCHDYYHRCISFAWLHPFIFRFAMFNDFLCDIKTLTQCYSVHSGSVYKQTFIVCLLFVWIFKQDSVLIFRSVC